MNEHRNSHDDAAEEQDGKFWGNRYNKLFLWYMRPSLSENETTVELEIKKSSQEYGFCQIWHLLLEFEFFVAKS